jgi:phage shock protein A
MADNLRSRVARVIAGGAHALIDKIEDAAPIAILEQHIREVEAITDEVRTELGRVAASRHLAQQQHVSLNREHETLSASVGNALGSAREDLAKTAIARQIDIEAQLPILETSLADLSSQEKELSGFVDGLMGKKREMERAVRDLEKAKQTTQISASQPGASTSTINAKLSNAQSAFDRTYFRQSGLDTAGHAASVDQLAKLKELNDLVRENKINERLAALKAK